MEILTRFARAGSGGPGWMVRTLGGALLTALLLAAAAVPACAGTVADEYELKAAVLFNVSRFVEWPAWKMLPPQDPFVIGIVGPAAIVHDMEKALQNKSVWGKKIVVRRLKAAAEGEQCHLAFVAQDEGKLLRGSGPALAKAAVLMTGEGGDFARDGGTISLVLKDSQLQMEVNLKAAHRTGLTVSSRLLQLATIVER